MSDPKRTRLLHRRLITQHFASNVDLVAIILIQNFNAIMRILNFEFETTASSIESSSKQPREGLQVSSRSASMQNVASEFEDMEQCLET